MATRTARQATERDLGKIEMQITLARNALCLAALELQAFGHDDSASEIEAILKQLRQIRSTTQQRIAR